ncbi:MAG: MaoC family dehydratase N-terminal domain-containing protein [Actinobacteria bacterium]|nr:MaoC family dehydratase N-terminal domain-containing protein [Actinomycetota bacterium]
MGFNLDNLGNWSEDKEFKVEADRAKAYAAATNDPIPAHVAGESAPPIFAVVPVWEAMGAAAAQVIPPDVLPMVVHGEQDITFHQPIRPGTVLVSKAAPVGVHVKGSGTTVVAKTETRDENGDLVNEQYFTTFIRGLADGESRGDEAPDHRFAEEVRATDPAAEVSQQLDADQTFRYSDASGDLMPIHLDDDFAKAVGLPGIIIHGLCTMAFTSHAVIQGVCDGDAARLRRLAVRFSKPVLPSQQITTRIWKAGEREGRTVYAFETTNPEGDLVIKDGLAEVS